MRIFSLIKRFLALNGVFGPEQGSGFSMHSLPFMPLGGGAASGGYQINNSVRLRASASGYLSRTPGVSGDRQKFTISIRFRRGKLGQSQNLISTDTAGTSYLNICINANDTITVRWYNTSVWDTTPSPVFRDTTGHYHLVFAFDTTQATSSNRLKIYAPTLADGNETTPLTAGVSISQNDSGEWNQSGQAHYIGKAGALGSYDFDGVISEVIHVDGQQLDATYFGERNADNVWVPKAYSGTYGTNGFHLDFADAAVTSGSNAGLGKDVSGNGNYWNTSGISVTAGSTYDALTDTPTNVYATIGPWAMPVGSIGDGGLAFTRGSTANHGSAAGSIALPTTGSWCWEVVATNSVNAMSCGVADARYGLIPVANEEVGRRASYTDYAYRSDGNKWSANSSAAYGATYTSGDVIGFVWDADAQTLTAYKNGTTQGTMYSSITQEANRFFPCLSVAETGYAHFNFGQRGLAYTYGSAKHLCSANLPAVAITDPSVAFQVTLATESNIDSAVATARTGWTNYVDILKNRTAGSESWAWRFSHDSGNEYSVSAGSVSRAANRTNSGTDNWVGYSLRIGASYGTAAGSVSHTNGADTTVTHGVGVSSRQVIFLFPRTSGSSVKVHHADCASGELLDLCSQGGDAADTSIKSVSSTAFAIGSGMATGTYDYLVISERSGLIKLGKYTGNGSADGPYNDMGGESWAVISKVIGSTDHWSIFDTERDPYNVADSHLYMDTVDNESTTNNTMDILASGRKIRTSGNMLNYGVDHVYISILRHPRGGSNVSPAPAR